MSLGAQLQRYTYGTRQRDPKPFNTSDIVVSTSVISFYVFEEIFECSVD